MLRTSNVIMCNRCDVPVNIADTSDDEARVECPVCGADFGTWGSVRPTVMERVDQPYRDRDSWRTEMAS